MLDYIMKLYEMRKTDYDYLNNLLWDEELFLWNRRFFIQHIHPLNGPLFFSCPVRVNGFSTSACGRSWRRTRGLANANAKQGLP